MDDFLIWSNSLGFFQQGNVEWHKQEHFVGKYRVGEEGQRERGGVIFDLVNVINN